jgi:hypothetical protein
MHRKTNIARSQSYMESKKVDFIAESKIVLPRGEGG